MKKPGEKAKEFHKSQETMQKRRDAFDEDERIQQRVSEWKNAQSASPQPTRSEVLLADARLARDFTKVSAQRRRIAQGDCPIVAARDEPNAMLDIAAARRIVTQLGKKNPTASTLVVHAKSTASSLRSLRRETGRSRQQAAKRRSMQSQQAQIDPILKKKASNNGPILGISTDG